MLKYRLFVKNTFLVFLPLFWGYMLHAATFLQEEEEALKNTKYEGATIELSKMGDKAKQGIEDHIDWITNKYTPSSFSVNMGFFFNGQPITKKELNNPTWDEVGFNLKVVPTFQPNDLKEVFSGGNLDITTSRGDLIKAMEKKIDIPSLEKKTGLRATVKMVIHPIALKKLPSSFNKLPQMRRRNIFKNLDHLFDSLKNREPKPTQEEIQKAQKKAMEESEKLSESGYIVFSNEDGNIRFENVMIFIELETPDYRRKRLTRLWGKRILIGSAVALPILLLLWGLFSRNKKNKKPPQIAKKVTTTATSSKKEASPTEETNTKRRRRKRTRRANRTNP